MLRVVEPFSVPLAPQNSSVPAEVDHPAVPRGLNFVTIVVVPPGVVVLVTWREPVTSPETLPSALKVMVV